MRACGSMPYSSFGRPATALSAALPMRLSRNCQTSEPREVVRAALYLLSDASSYTTGATLRVDGGMP
ncbi:hypothetical protein IQ63_39530 [Streptomyces acidiscabies]|uniref:SDR family oxidoreductase n=1 Tax=Streptomyces acidiscabies TaxID=42234 RepID=A0A0L0JJE4_9ACTN|nr:hypothetical protein IQ63_39530 [Streptomyces acidiscabies]